MRRRKKYKLYGGTVDIGGKISRAFSRLTRTVMSVMMIVLFEISMSFAISIQGPSDLYMSDDSEFSQMIEVPVRQIGTNESEVGANHEIDDPNILDENDRGTYLGTFCVTHYCSCSKCNGSNAGKTAIGYVSVPWNTVAVDPDLIPLGSTLYIEGYGTVNAIDTGSLINGYHIDMMTNNHEEAIHCGVVYKEVYLL